MEYIRDYLGNNYIMFNIGKKKFRLQERSNYDSDIIQASIKERKKFAMKVILGGEGRLIKDFIYFFSFNSRLLFNDNGSVCSCTIMNSNNHVDDY